MEEVENQREVAMTERDSFTELQSSKCRPSISGSVDEEDNEQDTETYLLVEPAWCTGGTMLLLNTNWFLRLLNSVFPAVVCQVSVAPERDGNHYWCTCGYGTWETTNLL